MKNKFRMQLYQLLPLSVLIIIVIGFSIFSFVSSNYMIKSLERQAVQNNQVIGEKIIHLLKEIGFSSKEDHQQMEILQNICRETDFPNGGFICAINPKGVLVAHPDINLVNNKNAVTDGLFQDMNSRKKYQLDKINKNTVFSGFFTMNTIKDIVAILPIENSKFRIIIHQDKKLLDQKVFNFIIPLFLMGILFIVTITSVIYLSTRKLTFRYMNEIEIYHKELLSKNHELERLSNERNHLLHVLTHDLANPIGAILSSIELLKEDKDDIDEYISFIETSSHNSMNVINLIRTLLALEEKKINVDMGLYNLHQLVNNAINIMRSIINNKNITVNIDIDDTHRVYVEQVSFENSVLNNLISNAVKFSDNGSSISIYSEKINDKYIALYVKDSGIGIPDDLIDIVFDVTKKTTRKGTAGEVGTGFGMPIVKKFVESYHGAISIISGKNNKFGNHGTIIKILLLYHEPDKQTIGFENIY